MSNQDALAASVARDLMAWRLSRTPRQPVTALPAGDLEAAYAAQDHLLGLLGENGAGEIVGYKIALTSQTMQQMVGVDHPLGGALFASVVHRSPAALALDGFVHLGIECELAVRVGEDLPASGAPYDRERVALSVASCAPAFELVEDAHVDYERLDAISLIADNCWNAGVVIGEYVDAPAAGWLTEGFVAAATRLSADGSAVGEGRVGDAMGHPFEAVAWVANLLATRDKSIERDMMIMTGSTVKTYFPNAGEALHYEVEGMGEVRLSL